MYKIRKIRKKRNKHVNNSRWHMSIAKVMLIALAAQASVLTVIVIAAGR